MQLSLVIPCGVRDGDKLYQLLRSIASQSFQKEDLEVLVITEGNSEEAKAIGMRRASGDILGLFCADNILVEPDFLEVLSNAATQKGVVGSYTAHYAYRPEDSSLNRYFALLGANDSLCWWLEKVDRASYLEPVATGIEIRQFNGVLPSLGDNGCFYQAAKVRPLLPPPVAFGSCMCFCTDLAKAGQATWAVVSTHALWHRTGGNFWSYLSRRLRYVDRLYWQKYPIRRWHLVSTPSEWGASVLFAVASLLVVPQLFLPLRGYRQIRDPAWAWHPVVCLCLTFLYAWSLCSHLMHLAWSSARSTDRRS